jgi:hypothetical protein
MQTLSQQTPSAGVQEMPGQKSVQLPSSLQHSRGGSLRQSTVSQVSPSFQEPPAAAHSAAVFISSEQLFPGKQHTPPQETSLHRVPSPL